MERRALLGLFLAVFLVPQGTGSPPHPDFSGIWKQSNERCIPVKTGNVTLRIDHRDPELIVETSILRGAGLPRQAVQRYSTDGKASVWTGADGDEFQTKVTWSGAELIFAVEEHEDGRVLPSRETWTLIEDGAALQRVRERSNGEKQTLIYSR